MNGINASLRLGLLIGSLLFAAAVLPGVIVSSEAFAQSEGIDASTPVEDAAAPDASSSDAPSDAAAEGAAVAAEVTEAQASAGEEAVPFWDRDFTDILATAWNATLFTAGDTQIKLNQLIVALFVALIGLWLAKLVTGIISARLVRVGKLSETVAYTIGKVIYYVAAIVVLLMAMQVAGIPTTVFTVLGGALAIGVGFGAQNLFNNLISGIIILTEKPIRRNDIVEIDSMEGRVAEIGNRRTRIRRFDGVDVLVPNSTFLETNVINWTLHDALVRGCVEVGVAYGSPVKKVRDLMLRSAEEHDKVQKSPAPTVLFTEFGDNTLNFAMYFWTEIQSPLDRKRLESDLRFAIDELFLDQQITIAFPQRDVHLDTLRPLEVRMVKDAGANE
ncbi:MAG: mechanosensitive ion channel family protein [Phycisphaeraceae bacterium]